MRTASNACALVILVSGIVWKPAFAVTPAASFSVSATVVAGCRVSANATASRLDAAKLADSASIVSIICSNIAPYNVDVSKTALPHAILSSSFASAAAGRASGQQYTASDVHPDVITVTVTY